MDKTKKTTTQSYRFVTVIKPAEEGGYYAYCPLLPGCISQGDTYEETMTNIKEAIDLYVEGLLAHEEEVPYEALEEHYLVDIPVNIPFSIYNPHSRSKNCHL